MSWEKKRNKKNNHIEIEMTYQSKSTMTAHAVSGNTNTARIKLGECSKDGLRQFLGDVAVHVIAGVVGGLCSVDVEASAGAEVVCVILALDVEAAWWLLASSIPPYCI
jgi:hypothetical protein